MAPQTNRPGEAGPEAATYSATRARQGRLGRRVLYILIVGLILGAIYVLWATIWAVNESDQQPGQLAPAADPSSAPLPAPPNRGGEVDPSRRPDQ